MIGQRRVKQIEHGEDGNAQLMRLRNHDAEPIRHDGTLRSRKQRAGRQLRQGAAGRRTSWNRRPGERRLQTGIHENRADALSAQLSNPGFHLRHRRQIAERHIERGMTGFGTWDARLVPQGFDPMRRALSVRTLRRNRSSFRASQYPVFLHRARRFTHLFIRLPQFPMGFICAPGFGIGGQIAFIEMNRGGIPAIRKGCRGLIPQTRLGFISWIFNGLSHWNDRRRGATGTECHQQHHQRKGHSTAGTRPSSLHDVGKVCAQCAPTRPTPFQGRNTRSRTLPSPAHRIRVPR